MPELRLLIVDGTERPVRRSKDDKKQRRDYSGKKKAHRKKNLLVTAERRVVYLGRTAPGQRARQEARRPCQAALPNGRAARQGTRACRATSRRSAPRLQPRKKPKRRELRPYEKAINQVISRTRIVVEHAIAGVKRCRIVADTFRGWRKNLVDEVMLAACGLHNLRESCRAVA